MERNRTGLYRRAKNAKLKELIVKKSDSYEQVVAKGVAKLGLPSCSSTDPGILLRASGAVIEKSPLVVDGQTIPWTLGAYLRFLHISADKLKLGIPMKEDVDDISSLSSEEETAKQGQCHANTGKKQVII